MEEIKIFGIRYRNSKNQSFNSKWEELEREVTRLIDKFYFKQTSIFGRSIIINSLVQPKILYIIHTLDPPKHITHRIQTYIRNFIFKGTTRKIRHSTLIQGKLDGGINLFDIQSKIETFRIKYIKDIIQHRKSHPLAHYYIGLHITQYIKPDNKAPHSITYIPSFYHTCLHAIKKYKHIMNTNTITKNIYTAIIKTKSTPLHEQIQWEW